MKFRQADTPPVAAAKASFSTSTAYRFKKDPRLPSQKKERRGRRRPDPLAGIFEAEVVSMLKAAPGLRSIAILEEMLRRHPELGVGIRRLWSGKSAPGAPSMGRSRRSSSGRSTSPAVWDCRISPTWATSASRSRGRRSSTGSIISGSPIPASSTPTSCSAVRASSPWRRGCRTPYGRSAARLGNINRQPLGRLRNLDLEAQKDLTARYEDLCGHYRMTPTRNNGGLAHENGSIEGPHGHLKRAIDAGDVRRLRCKNLHRAYRSMAKKPGPERDPLR